ncbi:MAG: IS256 family transposase [Nitrospiria bacterium]
METIAKREKKGKGNCKKPICPPTNPVGLEDLDAKVALIQALIPLGLEAVLEALEEEVTQLAGARYQRAGRQPGHVRWTKQQGWVYLGDQKLAIRYRRVRDQRTHREVPLATYRKFQEPRGMHEGLLRRVLVGLSCGRYRECAEAVPEAFGLSRSSVSRRFIQASARKLKVLMERDLSPMDLVALFLDGKSFAEDAMVIAVGVTLSGEKVILGFVQTATENERVLTEFLQGLVARGLRTEAGLLCIIDGSKGLRAAIRAVWGEAMPVQRCQWHKRENVVGYLPKARQPEVRRQLQAAYGQATYEAAKARLLQIRSSLQRENPSAAASLEEGLEETLTLHRLGVAGALAQSLATTNVLESINAQLGRLTRNVTRWHNGIQKHRWVASALLEIEPRLRKIKGYQTLPQLRAAILQKQAVSATTAMQAAA